MLTRTLEHGQDRTWDKKDEENRNTEEDAYNPKSKRMSRAKGSKNQKTNLPRKKKKKKGKK